jgi:hypothetical protein
MLPRDRPSTEVGAEYDRAIVGRFGDHCHRPSKLPPILGQVGKQLNYRPPAIDGGGHRFGTGLALRQEGSALPDEPTQMSVATDLPGARVVDHHVRGPRRLKIVRVPAVQGVDVLSDRVSLTGCTSLLSRQLHGTDEVRKPRHLEPPAPVCDD